MQAKTWSVPQLMHLSSGREADGHKGEFEFEACSGPVPVELCTPGSVYDDLGPHLDSAS